MGIENLALGFQIAITPFNLFMALVGIVLGTIIGVLPGLGGANGVAILLPLTFTMPPTSAIILLTSIYWGALFGGAITSILFNIPGEPWSVATTFDGYPLARQGQGGQALTAAFTSSFVGAFFSIVLITLFAPILAEIALKFGPPEFFAIQLLTFSSFRRSRRRQPTEVLGVNPDRIHPCDGRARYCHRPTSPHFRLYRSHEGLRLYHRGDRSVRHR